MDPLEAKFSAEMKELSTKTDLGYEKASAAYFANESDPDYERHMKQWYAQMKGILDDKGNPEQAAKLRATLELEYKTEIGEWDKAQIAKLLGKK
jgi:elongation factor P hydroxylase